MDIHAAAFLVVGVIIFIFNCGPYFVRENREFQKKLAILKPELKDDEKSEAKERLELVEEHE